MITEFKSKHEEKKEHKNFCSTFIYFPILSTLKIQKASRQFKQKILSFFLYFF